MKSSPARRGDLGHGLVERVAGEACPAACRGGPGSAGRAWRQWSPRPPRRWPPSCARPSSPRTGAARRCRWRSAHRPATARRLTTAGTGSSVPARPRSTSSAGSCAAWSITRHPAQHAGPSFSTRSSGVLGRCMPSAISTVTSASRDAARVQFVQQRRTRWRASGLARVTSVTTMQAVAPGRTCGRSRSRGPATGAATAAPHGRRTHRR